MWRCYICADTFDTGKAILLHLKVIHSLTADSTYDCNQNDCDRKYPNAKSFRKHLKTHSSESHNDIASGSRNAHVFSDFKKPVCIKSPEKEHVKLPIDKCYKDVEDSIEHLGTWLYGHSELNRKTANDIIKQVRQCVTRPMGMILSEHIAPHVSETPVKSELDDIIEMLKNPFSKLSTEHSLFQVLNKKGYFVYPRTFIIDVSVNIARKNNKVCLLPKKRVGIILPLTKTLKQFFEMPGVFNIITNYMRKLESDSSGSISNLIQSKHWKNKIQDDVESKELIIPLYIYFDDFECGNALGSHAGSQSISGTYCQVACLPPQYSALLENIFVTMIHYSSDSSFGNGIIYRELIKYINILDRDGICIKGPNGSVKIYFKLALILGDNLGLNSSLGFSKSFSSNYYCRICKAHKSSMITESKQNDQLLRTRTNYENDVHSNDPRNTGVREECVFNSLTSFP